MALALKQKLSALNLEELRPLLGRYYQRRNIPMEFKVTEKGFRCFEAIVMIDEKRLCAGFGRSQEEAEGNAARIALDAAIDSGDVLSCQTINSLLTFEEQAPPSNSNAKPIENEIEIENLRAENQKLRQLMEQIPSFLICPLSNQLLHDPVCAVDGYSYNRSAILAWFRTKGTSPVTGEPLSSKSIRDNLALRAAVDYYTVQQRALTGAPAPLNPKRNLYNTAYGHHIPLLFYADDELRSSEIEEMAEKTISGDFTLTKVQQ